MSIDFMSRILGMVVFSFVGARLGVDAAESFNIPEEAAWFFFSLIGFLFGLIVTPYITVYPIRFVNQSVKEMPVQRLVMAIFGIVVGLVIALLMAYPISFLGEPWNVFLPISLSVAGGYLGMTIFGVRAQDIVELLGTRRGGHSRMTAMSSGRQLLCDTSVLIDGRIVDISKTGFLGGAILIPRFVMRELHQVADSSDNLRRQRGRRGLVKLNELQRNSVTPVKIIEDDIEEIVEVDDKLVALALQMDAALITNDFPLSQVAEGQGVFVLNINLLANAVRTVYIPGETFPLHIIQEGTDENQGVGYLDDGTMVVVGHGKPYMDRTVKVTVTKLINSPAGRMLFAEPEVEYLRKNPTVTNN